MLKNVPNCVLTFLDIDVIFTLMRHKVQGLIYWPDQSNMEQLDIQCLACQANSRIFDYIQSMKGCHGSLSGWSFATLFKT